MPFRLPRRLLLKAEGCDGRINAWCDDGTITVCFEYLDWVWRSAPEQTTPTGVAPIDAMAGPVVQFILHEAGHAVFDLLNIPIFGREEDAADQFAAYITLQAGKKVRAACAKDRSTRHGMTALPDSESGPERRRQQCRILQRSGEVRSPN